MDNGGRRNRGVLTTGRWAGFVGGLLLVWSMGLFWLSLGDHPLQVPDEGRYARTSQVMLETGDWLVPHIHNVPRLEKPPLIYWLQASSIALFGENEFAVRLPSALFASLTVLAILAFGRVIRDTGLGVIAAFLFALSPLTLLQARMATTDAVLNFFFTVAFFSGYLALKDAAPGQRRGLGRHWIVFFVATAGGLLTKGPVALLPCGLVVAWVAVSGSWKSVSWGRWLLGLSLSLTPLAVWALAVAVKHPQAWALWHEQIIDRAVGTGDHTRPIYFYLPVVLVGMFPATALLPLPGMHFTIAKARAAFRQAAFPAWCALALVTWLLVFSLNGGKQTAYMLPLTVPVALLAAWQLRNLTGPATDPIGPRGKPAMPIGPGSIVVILTAGWLVLGLAGTLDTPRLSVAFDRQALEQAGVMALACTPAVLLAWLAWALWHNPRNPARRAVALMLLAVAGNLVWTVAAETLEDGLTIPRGNPRLIDALNADRLLNDHDPLIEVGYSDPSLDFYLDRDVEQIPMNRLAWFRDQPDAAARLFFVEQKDWDRLRLNDPHLADAFSVAMTWHHLTRPLYILTMAD